MLILLFRLVVYLSVCYKTVEIWYVMIRIVATAAEYRRQANHALDLGQQTIDLEVLRELEKRLLGRWPALWKPLHRLSTAQRGSRYLERMKLLILTVAIELFTWPALMLILSGMTFAFPDPGYVTVDICFEALGLCSGVLSLTVDRAKLGFFENFRPILAVDAHRRQIAYSASEMVWHFTRIFAATWFVVVVGFGAIYYGLNLELERRGEHAFTCANPCADYPRIRLVYYSIVTIATVGYGDISPSHVLAIIATAGEILVGLLLLVVLVFSFSTTMQPERED